MPFPAEGVRLFYMGIYGGFGFDAETACESYLGLASGIVQGGNPPYSLMDFLAVYPYFFGPATSVVGTLTEGSNQITAVTGIASLSIGQLVVDAALPPGTVITAVNAPGNSATISNNATASDTGFTVYASPLLNLGVIQIYINLAAASLMQARWREAWPVAMALFIAHYCTLWMQTSGPGNPNPTAAQVVSQGLAGGILISKSVGDVSAGLQAIQGIEDWGAWTLTKYGQLLATMANAAGAGAIYVR